MVESRIFWLKFNDVDKLIPMLEKPVLYDIEEVRVDWVISCGLYIDVRLLRS